MDWMKFYCANPTPDRFVSEVRALEKDSSVEDPTTRMVVATFLGLVMRANAARIAGWTDELMDLTGTAREILQLAAWISNTDEGRAVLEKLGADPRLRSTSPPDLLSRKVDNGALLDILWAHYLATGDALPVRRIISALEYMSDFGAAERFKTTPQTDEDRARAMNDALFQAASWSLTSLMHEHPPLRALCERLFDEADLTPNERVGLAIALQKVAPETWDVHIDPVTSMAQVSRKGVPDKSG
jgi:hypothetical protein